MVNHGDVAMRMLAHMCLSTSRALVCCVKLFERTTFLVIATSTTPHPAAPSPDSMPGTRYEQTSALIKHFKHSLSRVRSEFCSLELDLAEFTAVLDEMTRNTYVLVICHGAGVGEFA